MSPSRTPLLAAVALIMMLALYRPIAAQPLPQATTATSLPTALDVIQIQRTIAPPLTPGQASTVTLRLTGKENGACLGMPQKPVDAMFVIDTSSSAGMGSGSNWEHTQQLTQQLIDLMSLPIYQTLVITQQSRIGLVTIQLGQTGSESKLLSPLTDQYQQLRDKIASVTPNGDTDVSDGIKIAAAELSKAQPNHAQAMVLILHDSVAVSDRTIAAVKDLANKNIAVYVVVNPERITKDALTQEKAQELAPKRIFMDPQPADLRQLFILAGEGDPKQAARLLNIKEQVNATTNIMLSVPNLNGQISDKTITWNLPAINRGEPIDVNYQIQVQAGSSGEVTFANRIDYIDCNGVPFTQGTVNGQTVQIVAAPPSPASTVVVLTYAPTPIGASVTTAPPTQPLPTRERSPTPTHDTRIVFPPPWPWPWWFWLLLLIPLLLLLLWLLSRLFRRPAPPPPPIRRSEPEPQIEPFDPQAPPSWIKNFNRGDPLSETGQPLYPSAPQFRDTLIIGVGEVGGVVLDQIAPILNRRFNEYPTAQRNVRLLYIDVQPTGASQSATAYRPTRLNNEEQIARLQPNFSDVDAILAKEPEKYPHLGWWKSGVVGNYGRATGRMALFYDLRNGPDPSIIWQKLRRVLEGLQDPEVWIVASTFDDIGSGMAVDLARITRLVKQQEKPPSLLLALPAPCWSGPDQPTRNIATLREIERLMRNEDVPFVYNLSSGHSALDQWLKSAAPIGQVYLFDAVNGEKDQSGVLDLSNTKAQVSIGALMSDSLLALMEKPVYDQFQQQLNPLVAAAGTLINTDRQSVVGSLGCYSLYLPVDAILSALEKRTIHELLFAEQVGLLSMGQFDTAFEWKARPIDELLREQTREGKANAESFINALGIDPKNLAGADPEAYKKLRSIFIQRLVTQADKYLNGTGVGSIYANRIGGLTRAYAWAKELYTLLIRVKQPDPQQCARWAGGLRDELKQWLETLVGSLDGVDQPETPALMPTTAKDYLDRRSELRELASSPVRRLLMDNDKLDQPFYELAIRNPSSAPSSSIDNREPMARMLSRIGWWCQAPEEGKANAPWVIRLIILPPGYESESPATFRRYAYSSTERQAILDEIGLLAQIFSRKAIGQGSLNTLMTTELRGLDATMVAAKASPRLSYADMGTKHGGQGQMLVAITQNDASSQFVARLHDVRADLNVSPAFTADPYAYRVLRVIYPVPMSNTTAYNNEAWGNYQGSPELHVFSAEQYAVELEEKNSALKNKRIHLSADIVQLVAGEDQQIVKTSEDPQLVKLFIRCWIYGLLSISSTGRYQLQIDDNQAPKLLFEGVISGNSLPVWETLRDLVSSRYQSDRQTLLYRSRRADTVRRIEDAIQRKRSEIGEGREDYLDTFKQRQIEPLRAEAAPTAKELATFIDIVIDKEMSSL